MTGIHGSFVSYTFPHRPFRRRRYPVFTGWGACLLPCWENISRIITVSNKIGNSLLGKVVIYAAADTLGSIAGDALGSTVLEKLGSQVGRNLMSSPVLAAIAGSEILALSFSSMSKIKKISLLAMSAMTIALMQIASEERRDYGAWAGSLIAAQIGSLAGTILGGQTFLRMAGSPTIFWDPEKPWNSYSSNTAKFLIVGMAFESVVVTPSTSLIGSFLSPFRRLTCIILQNLAYNSNSLSVFFRRNLRNNQTLGNPELPIIASVAINTYCGLNADFFRKKFSQYSLQHIFPSLAKNRFDLVKKIDRFLPTLIVDTMRDFTENSDKMVSVAISAFHEYINLLKESIELIEAHKKFKEAFLNQTGEHLNYKQQIVKMIREKISTDSYLWNEGIQVIIDYAWNRENNLELMKTLGKLIGEMEVSLVGFSFTSPQQSSYLNEILEVYLEHYFIFLLLNYTKLEKLTSEKEYQSILALSHIIFAYYEDSVIPRPIAKTCGKIISLTLQFSFNIKKSIALFVYEPEQTSHLLGEKLPVIPNYIDHSRPINSSGSITSLTNEISPINNYYN